MMTMLLTTAASLGFPPTGICSMMAEGDEDLGGGAGGTGGDDTLTGGDATDTTDEYTISPGLLDRVTELANGLVIQLEELAEDGVFSLDGPVTIAFGNDVDGTTIEIDDEGDYSVLDADGTVIASNIGDDDDDTGALNGGGDDTLTGGDDTLTDGAATAAAAEPAPAEVDETLEPGTKAE